MFRSILFALLFLAAPALARDPKAAIDELLSADRAFSDQAGTAVDIVAGLEPMFDEDIVLPVPGQGHAVGKEAVIAALRASPSYKDGKASWAPIRGGISADGTHGFTYGFLSLTGGEAAKGERKYLAYWVKRPEGWRVVAYRNVVREPGEASMAMLPPSLPAFTAEPKNDAGVIAAHEKSVAAAEKSFSDHAQNVGLKTAFREYGREDAMNMYAGAGFAVGLDAVTAGFKAGEPTTIHWSTERSFVASSGDLGVSIGTIRSNDPDKTEGFPFFTIWRRDSPDQPWRYIAE